MPLIPTPHYTTAPLSPHLPFSLTRPPSLSLISSSGAHQRPATGAADSCGGDHPARGLQGEGRVWILWGNTLGWLGHRVTFTCQLHLSSSPNPSCHH